AAHRARLGPVMVFAPLDEDWTWINDLGLAAVSWNPVAECSTASAAAEFADAFTAEGRRGEATHWYLSAANLLTALLLLENEAGEDMRSLLSLLNTTAQPKYAGLAAIVHDQTASELF